ncbi:hypothetical protein PVAG01_06373 [Phlyctema vagabunda]|uniref:Uncharacterized protein n=1 Tax=Phlyctema vagabunda TaxID=108571 RepID=A0ABR4PFV4_9HELO
MPKKHVGFAKYSELREVDREQPLSSPSYHLNSKVVETKVCDGKHTSGVFIPIAAPYKLPLGNKVGRCLTPRVLLSAGNTGSKTANGNDLKDSDYELALKRSIENMFQQCPIIHKGAAHLQPYSSEEYIIEPCPTPEPEPVGRTPFEEMSEEELDEYVYRYRGPWAPGHWWPRDHPTKWHTGHRKTVELELYDEMPAAYKPSADEIPDYYNVYRNRVTGFWIVQHCHWRELNWRPTKDEYDFSEAQMGSMPVPKKKWSNSRLRSGGSAALEKIENVEWTHDGPFCCKPDPYSKAPDPRELPIPAMYRK